MFILSLDTSTSLASAALARDERIVAESLFSCDRTLSSRLMPEIERLLALEGLSAGDVDLFAAAVGPGSFTGVRCGVATVQGLSLATGRPCIGFSTLAMLAANLPLSPLPVCPLLDARKSEVYGALYDCSASIPVPLISDCVLAPELLLDRINEAASGPVIFVGEGAVRYHEAITARMGERALFAPFPHNGGRAANGALLARHAFEQGRALADPSHLLPAYIRPSEAELAKRGNPPA
ncbi:MAG TPA: tRNA (adenosine(37)-N6)-threonylcarbamoyltransferase complex dimerization subunit type 1 TsaB [Desulfuromonadaceae bacterium]